MKNLLMAVDAYKGSHYQLFPPDAEAVRYYMAPRKPINQSQKDFVFFGITSFLNDFLDTVPDEQQIRKAKYVWDQFGIGGAKYPFPMHVFETMYALHGKNYKFPINIYGLPEGAVRSDYNTPVLIVECFDKDFLFLPGMIETALQRDVWYGSTVATLSRNVKLFLKTLYEQTVDSDCYWTIDSRLHDFGARGVSSYAGAENGGLAHLINFKGTDTMEAVMRGYKLYGIEPKDLASSIPAAEHSTITSWGKDIKAEKTALIHMLNTYGKNNPLIAFVSDSFDFKRMIDEGWGDPEIQKLARKLNVQPVVRPDSGSPVEMVMYALNSLSRTWGYTTNTKGYKVLDGISVIQGDGMDYDKIIELYTAITKAGFSAQNLAVGMGGGLLQKIDRDTMSWSMKMYQIKRKGMWINVQKTVITDQSKIGWNPQNGLDIYEWVKYYEGDKNNATFPELPEYIRDFAKIRERATAGALQL